MNQEPSNTPSWKAREHLVGGFFRRLFGLFDYCFTVIGLRSGKKFWGVVYDSVTKEPLDPAIVKLVYVGDTRTETVITDMYGQYGFLVRPGKFKILPKKANYSFPSRYASGDRDEVFDNLYHGEFFELSEDWDVVAPNIPMDPTGTDWNQAAKRTVTPSSYYRMKIVQRLAHVVFWFLFVLSGVLTWYNRAPKISAAAVVFCLLLVILFLNWIVPHPRLWGRVIVRQGDLEPENLQLELHNPKVPGIVLGQTVTKESGRFLLRGHPGEYELHIKEPLNDGSFRLLATIKVLIYANGLYNGSVKLKSAE